MKSRVRGAAAPLFALLLLAAAPRAEPPEPYLVEYRAYSAAVDAGDTAGAIEHGRAAWQAAEQALGDHRRTAILAYNYGRLIVFTDTTKALEPLERSLALAKAGIENFPLREVSVYASYARFVANGKKRGDARRLREALTGVGIDVAPPNADLAPMWLLLATDDTVDERYEKALESGRMAEAALRALNPDLVHPIANAIAIQGIARLVPYPREPEDVLAAHRHFERAIVLFPPQEDIDSFDPLFATIYAWDAAASAAMRTLGAETSDWHRGPHALFAYQEDPDIVCGPIDWDREAPEYPMRALHRGYLGAVFLGFRIGDDLRVTDVRVLAEVPKATFGAAVLDAAKNWRAVKIPEDLDPRCANNLTTTVHFVLD